MELQSVKAVTIATVKKQVLVLNTDQLNVAIDFINKLLLET